MWWHKPSTAVEAMNDELKAEIETTGKTETETIRGWFEAAEMSSAKSQTDEARGKLAVTWKV